MDCIKNGSNRKIKLKVYMLRQTQNLRVGLLTVLLILVPLLKEGFLLHEARRQP
jgi:type II secretory pathway component PulL